MIFEHKTFSVPSRPSNTATHQKPQQQQLIQQQPLLQQQQQQQQQQFQHHQMHQQLQQPEQVMSTSESESSIDEILDMLTKQTGKLINANVFHVIVIFGCFIQSPLKVFIVLFNLTSNSCGLFF